jgi:hypothetical protein
MKVISDDTLYEEQYGGSNRNLQSGGQNIDRTRYVEVFALYKEITSKPPPSPERISELTRGILDFLHELSLEQVVSIVEDESRKPLYLRLVEEIFSRVPEYESNFIGKINVVSLQIIILFTFIAKTQRPDGFMYETQKIFYHLVSGDVPLYLDYKRLKGYLISLGQKGELEKAREEYPEAIPKFLALLWYPNQHTEDSDDIFMITSYTYISTTDILDGMMNNVHFIGVAFDVTSADGDKLLPIDFLIHDINHGDEYLERCVRYAVDRSLLKSFYEFIIFFHKNNPKLLDKDGLYKIKFVFFLLVHETDPTYFLQRDGRLPDENFVIDEGIGDYINYPYNQFKDPDDLKMLLPSKVRKSIEELTDDEEKSEIIQDYIEKAVAKYLKVLKIWNDARKRSLARQAGTARGGKRKSKKSKKTRKSRKGRTG